MSLSLYVLRHAKAEELAGGAGDLARALKRRGRKAAERAGRTLAQLAEEPDLVLSSSAVRAAQTAEFAHQAGGWKAPIELRASLYAAGTEALLGELCTVADDDRGQQVRRLLLVGHQPGLSLLIAELTGSEPDFPTGALARLDLGLERWNEVRPRCARLMWLLTPDVIAAVRPRSRV